MDFSKILTHWYSENKRELVFRKTKDPYTIWISEIIFQQTRINQGIAYFQRFIERFPTVKDLAAAQQSEVLKYWEGLGYYSRARNLHLSAQYIINELGGVFPSQYQELLTLKGVGDYTAAAISSICFNEPQLAIDGNALRVYARVTNSFLNIAETSTKEFFKDKFTSNVQENAGEFNQAVMELGATVCTPKNPNCEDCPISQKCLAFSENTQNELPFKKKKLVIKNVKLDYYLYYNSEGLFLKHRNKQGIWKGLYELVPEKINTAKTQLETQVKHKLTHRNLSLNFYSQIVDFTDTEEIASHYKLEWVKWDEVENYAFPKPIKDFIFTFVENNKTEKNLLL